MLGWLLAVVVAGCQTPKVNFTTGKATQILTGETSAEQPLTVLSVTGGLCLVAGMALLVVTAGRKGWYPVVGGIILVILNYMVAKYDDYLFYPLVVCTALISGAWTYKIIKQVLQEKRK
mgnify:FL=1|tara:strand:+ start:745 stop:1101 length:357 start_codon:yes stop_codon:yes gene_type:complete